MVRYDALKDGDMIRLNEDWADLGVAGDVYESFGTNPCSEIILPSYQFCKHYLDGHVMFPEDNGEMPEFDYA